MVREPTIVRMPSQTDVVQRETFAPILYVLTYRELDEAIALQNGVPQGLASSIFTTDLREAERFLAGGRLGLRDRERQHRPERRRDRRRVRRREGDRRWARVGLRRLAGVHAPTDRDGQLHQRPSARAGHRVRRPRLTGRVTGSLKLVWFVPPAHLRATRDAVFAAGAGWIGDYSRCSWATLGDGAFRGGEGTTPAVGEAGRDRRSPSTGSRWSSPPRSSTRSSPRCGPRIRTRSPRTTSTSESTREGDLWTDGGARGNPGPAAYAYVLEAEDGTVLDARGEAIGVATNNVAEYSALVAGLAAGGRAGGRRARASAPTRS